MRYFPLEEFAPQPHTVYYIHVQSSPDAQAVGVSMIGLGTLAPCRGADNLPDDGYNGHVYLENECPTAGASVQYYRGSRLVAHALTDEKGRHRVQLPPGSYAYQVVPIGGLSIGGAPQRFGVEVAAGKKVPWEAVAGDGSTLESSQREILYAVETFVGEWNANDGVLLHWHDVQESLLALSRVLKTQTNARLRQLSFSHFARPEMLHTFRSAGLIVEDLKWSESAWALAFRNLNALLAGRVVSLRPYDEANRQVKSAVLKPTGHRVEGGAFDGLHLAQARAAAIHAASTLGALQRGGVADLGALGERGKAAVGMATAGGRLPSFLRKSVAMPTARGGGAPSIKPPLPPRLWRKY